MPPKFISPGPMSTFIFRLLHSIANLISHLKCNRGIKQLLFFPPRSSLMPVFLIQELSQPPSFSWWNPRNHLWFPLTAHNQTPNQILYTWLIKHITILSASLYLQCHCFSFSVTSSLNCCKVPFSILILSEQMVHMCSNIKTYQNMYISVFL